MNKTMQGYHGKPLQVLEQGDLFEVTYRRFVGEIVARQEDELNQYSSRKVPRLWLEDEAARKM